MANIRQMGIVKLAIVAIVTCSMWGMSMGQLGLGPRCTTEIISLSPCVDYITGNSSTPSSSCCTQLATVVKADINCLCRVVTGPASDLAAGLNISRTLALGLPSACNVQTPPLSSCNAQSPSGSPEGAPSMTSGGSIGGGSKTTPISEVGSSGANKLTLATPLFLALFLVVSQALAFNSM